MSKEVFNRQKITFDVQFSPENLVCQEALAVEIRLAFSHSVRPDKVSLVIPCPDDLKRSSTLQTIYRNCRKPSKVGR